jgi:hypothetical protein
MCNSFWLAVLLLLCMAWRGVVRGTIDLNIVLAMTDENLDRFIEVAKSFR